MLLMKNSIDQEIQGVKYIIPKIIINGCELTEAQATTVRAAIEAFADSMTVPGRLGNDAHGEAMTMAYRSRIDEIRTLIFSNN